MANQKNKLKNKYRHTFSNAGERGWPSHDVFFFLILRLIDWEGRASFFRSITEQSVAKPM